MPAEHPPELKGFHNKNMLHAFIVFAIPASAAGWALYRQEALNADDDLQRALLWFFMAGVGAFMITILIKALVTVPKCPKCGNKMTQLETISMLERPNSLKKKSLFNPETSSRWRIVHCARCDLRYRIPGLSTN